MGTLLGQQMCPSETGQEEGEKGKEAECTQRAPITTRAEVTPNLPRTLWGCLCAAFHGQGVAWLTGSAAGHGWRQQLLGFSQPLQVHTPL